jgi:hypothetical protein
MAMRIGIDFDNTIVSYDALFFKVAREQDLVPADSPSSKLAVRDHLRRIGREDRWTEMQGYVYGARMDEALAFEGVINFIERAAQAGHQISIVSHKTRYPFIGPRYDLHAAARSWIERHLTRDGRPLLADEHVFFELTKTEKLARISTCGCEAFVDDLPEILLADDFPAGTSKLLFDPENHHQEPGLESVLRFTSWRQIEQHFGTP